MAALCSGNLSFSFDEAAFTPEEMAAVKRHPNLIDPFGGAKMRLQKDKEAAERAKLEAEIAETLAAQEQAQSEQLRGNRHAPISQQRDAELNIKRAARADVRAYSTTSSVVSQQAKQ